MIEFHWRFERKHSIAGWISGTETVENDDPTLLALFIANMFEYTLGAELYEDEDNFDEFDRILTISWWDPESESECKEYYELLVA